MPEFRTPFNGKKWHITECVQPAPACPKDNGKRGTAVSSEQQSPRRDSTGGRLVEGPGAMKCPWSWGPGSARKPPGRNPTAMRLAAHPTRREGWSWGSGARGARRLPDWRARLDAEIAPAAGGIQQGAARPLWQDGDVVHHTSCGSRHTRFRRRIAAPGEMDSRPGTAAHPCGAACGCPKLPCSFVELGSSNRGSGRWQV